MKKITYANTIINSALLATLPVHAGLFDDVVKVVTAPAQLIIQPQVEAVKVITGQQSPGQAVSSIGQNAGQTVRAGANVYGAVQNVVPNVAGNLAAAVAGDPGRAAVDAATFTQRFQHNLTQSAAYGVGYTLEGKNPAQVLGAPLAAALRSAYDQHSPNARPLPDYVKQTLSRFFNAAYLDTLRYSIGHVELSLPNAINVVTHSQYAVTINDLIVFPNDPGTAYTWWAHEIQHTIQYQRLGFDGFAYEYTVNYGALENEAAMTAQRVQFALYTPQPAYYRR
jgi:hypothetical protein